LFVAFDCKTGDQKGVFCMENIRIGIAGNIGVGKSTFVDAVINSYQEEMLGVLPRSEDFTVATFKEDFDTNLLNHDSELELIKKLARFPIAIDEACEGFKPHSITTYLFEVASQFNQFYRDCPVLPEKNKMLRIGRLALVDATKTVLNSGLEILGIAAPIEM